MFAERLKELRTDKGLSQGELAKIVGVKQQTIGGWEVGRTEPDHQITCMLADFFGVTTDYLLGREVQDTDTTADTINKIDHALLEDPELLAFWDETKKRPDLQLFLKQVKSASPKAIRQMMTIIKMIEDEESGEK